MHDAFTRVPRSASPTQGFLPQNASQTHGVLVFWGQNQMHNVFTHVPRSTSPTQGFLPQNTTPTQGFLPQNASQTQGIFSILGPKTDA